MRLVSFNSVHSKINYGDFARKHFPLPIDTYNSSNEYKIDEEEMNDMKDKLKQVIKAQS